MDFGSINPVVLVASLMVAAVPILLAAIGELVVEKAGVLNLGVEGMMIMGAICGFITAVSTGSPFLGFLGGAAGGAVLSLIFAFLTQTLLANQVATGLALTLFGLGLSSLMGQGYNGIKPPLTSAVPFGPLRDIPVLGRILFSHDWVVYFSVAIIAAVWWMLKYSRTGLILRAVGENHDAAHALGYKVGRIRLLAILFGGAMAGMGGAYISLIRVPQWTDGITAGAGWIALAIVVFASWKPWRVLIGGYLFGGISVLQLNLQAAGGLPLFIALLFLIVGTLVYLAIGLISLVFQKKPLHVPPLAVAVPISCAAGYFYMQNFAPALLMAVVSVEYLSMSPYLITIVVLVIMSSGKGRASLNAPAALGQNFHASR